MYIYKSDVLKDKFETIYYYFLNRNSYFEISRISFRTLSLSLLLQAFGTAKKMNITIFFDWFFKKTKTINHEYSNETNKENEQHENKTNSTTAKDQLSLSKQKQNK